MSRCFPYPPPGYEAREIDRGLIESIKLQKEIEKAKKERRREKKKEKKEKGDKSREDGVKGDKNRTSEKRHKEEGNQVEQYPDKKHGVVEQLEKSSLTEEYGRPANRASSDSSDSTQNSTCKRKRAEAATVLCDTPCSQGSGLRLRLSFKHKDQKSISLVPQTPSPSVSSRTPKDVIAPPAKDDSLLVKGSKYLCQEQKKSVSGISMPADFSRDLHLERNDTRWNQDQKVCEPSCSTSGRTFEIYHSSSLKDDRETANGVVARENKIQEISCSTSGRAIESLPVPKADGSELHPTEKKHKKRSRGQKMEDKFRELFMDWSPLPLNLPPACDEDQDWLSVETKQPCKQEAKRSRVADDSLWTAAGPGGPRASLLCEADIYALPYVVPF